MEQITKTKHHVDVDKFLEKVGANKNEIAILLFPENKYPLRAFSRILAQEAELSASQLSMLAEKLGCRVEDLYQPEAFDLNSIAIEGKDFSARFNPSTMTVSLYAGKDVIEKELKLDENITLQNFFKELKTRIQDWMELS